jgi:hypothetical protein
MSTIDKDNTDDCQKKKQHDSLTIYKPKGELWTQRARA